MYIQDGHGIPVCTISKVSHVPILASILPTRSVIIYQLFLKNSVNEVNIQHLYILNIFMYVYVVPFRSDFRLYIRQGGDDLADV